MAFAIIPQTRRPAVPLRSTGDLLEFASRPPPFLSAVTRQSGSNAAAEITLRWGEIDDRYTEAVQSSLRTANHAVHQQSDLVYLIINRSSAAFCWMDPKSQRLADSPQVKLDQVPLFLPPARHFDSNRSALAIVVDQTSVDVAQIESGRIVAYSTLKMSTAVAEIDRLAGLAPSRPMLMFGTAGNDDHLARVASQTKRHAVVAIEELATPTNASSTRADHVVVKAMQELALLDTRRRKAQANAFGSFAAHSAALVEGLGPTLQAVRDHRVAQLIIGTERLGRGQPRLWFDPHDPSQIASLPYQLACDRPASGVLTDVLIRAALSTDSSLYEISFADSIHPADGVAALLRGDTQ